MNKLILIITLFISLLAHSQERFNLDQLIEHGLKNNPVIKRAALEIQRSTQEKKAVYDFQKTSVNYYYGEINSSYLDQGWILAQEFEFPTVYFQKGQLQDNVIEQNSVVKQLTERELVKAIKVQYNEIVFLKNQIRFYQEVDKIFKHALEISMEHPRHDLESELMIAKHLEIELLIQQLLADIKISKYGLKALVFTEGLPFVTDSVLTRKTLPQSDSSVIKFHPVIQRSELDVSIAHQEIGIAKSSFLPDLYLEYFNNQMDGVRGFQGVGFGVSLPLIYSTQLGAMQSAKVNLEIQEQNLKNTQVTFEALFNQAYQEYHKNEVLLSVYDQSAEKTSKNLMRLSIERYDNDEIGYVEFSRDLDEAIDLHVSYLETLRDYNSSVIELEYFF